jgi:flagellar biosynthetic protein FlhB
VAGEKTEKATSKRKQEERKKGNVLMSREVNVVLSLLAIFFALRIMTPRIFASLQQCISEYFAMGASVEVIGQAEIANYFIKGCILFATTALPLLLVSSFGIIVLTMGQTRMLFASEAFSFKGDRLNPLSGIKKMFSMRSLVELLKALVKIVVLGYIIYDELKDAVWTMPRLMDMTAGGAAAYTGSLILAIVWKAGAVFVVLAAADYFYQWWEFERNLRMSKQEIKDEYKETEGDPQIKSRQKARREQAARQRMMANVPKADVVIRNPTHYAVALQYDTDKHRAPVVIAKGMDHLALRIIQVARDNDVYIMENRPLARSLFEEVELEREVPETFYQAIAEVLAFVYNLKEKEAERSSL